ncbi:universal stress protein [Thiohalomonas denitrificans]|uniref:Nucleotide-binding universal stress protein, UspA family n=1 Tax=Thiohalomonas denitrificans TaxID=415747 RepID=A0A1G5R0T8_9GAMM|nr:universal stress protein [Thiohalomonas denitrificans]SCZ67705.1 Nucleotide-binding universal stress protein, UspA family [Thiohalomonas denitrificans]
MKGFKNILYVSENAVEQDSALARAVSLTENNQADLTVIDVIPQVTAGIGLPPDLQARFEAERRQALDSLVAPHRERRRIHCKVLTGSMYLEVIREVLRDGYDLVIKPAANPDFLERIFGSEDMHLLRKCPAPVWLMKTAEKTNYECILAAVDFDPSEPESARQGLNRKLLELSSSLALSDFAQLHLVHVWDTPAEMLLRSWSDNPGEAASRYVESERSRHQNGMASLREGLRAQIGQEAYDYISPHFHLIQGSAARVIPAMAKQLQADLVVMGTVARTGIPGLFIGNTAETVLEQLRCSVLATKPPGFASPVTLR